MRWPRLLIVTILLGSIAGPVTAQPSTSRLWTLHFTNAEWVTTADSALMFARVELARLLGDTLSYVPDVFISTTDREFDSLIGGKFPDWGAAAAIPHRGMIVIKSPNHFRIQKSLTELLIHEYSHLALSDRLGLGRAPRWFDEGLAMRVSHGWSFDDNLTMSKAALFSGLIPLSEIDGVNGFGGPRAGVAYATSYQAVDYFYDTYGVEAVNRFLNYLAAGNDVDGALIQTIGATLGDFEAELEVYLKERFTIFTILADTAWIWIGLALLVVVGGILKYRQRRKYYKRWKEHEQLHSTDFDYGDPNNPEQVDDPEPWRSDDADDEPWRR